MCKNVQNVYWLASLIHDRGIGDDGAVCRVRMVMMNRMSEAGFEKPEGVKMGNKFEDDENWFFLFAKNYKRC